MVLLKWLGVKDWGLLDIVLVGLGCILIIKEFVFVAIVVMVMEGIYLDLLVLWLGLIIMGRCVRECRIGNIDKLR